MTTFGRRRRNSELQKAAEQVARAIMDEGIMPGYHHEVMARHRQEWPTLWRALDKLVRRAYDERR